MFKRILILFVVFIEVALNANAGIRVSPLTVELKTDRVRNNFLTAAIDVQGAKNETVRFKAYPQFFRITEYGTMDIVENENTPDCLINHARFVPNEFTVTNGKPQKLRITITNLKELPDGESRMVLFLEDVMAKEVLLPNNYKNVVTRLIVKTRIGIPVYVDKGKVVKVANFEDLKVEQNKEKDLTFKVKLNSTGNSRVRCFGKGQIIKDGKLISEFDPERMVLSSSSSFFGTGNLPLENVTEPGNYTLRLILSYEDEKGKIKKILKEVSFVVNELPKPKVEAQTTQVQKQTTAVKLPQ